MNSQVVKTKIVYLIVCPDGEEAIANEGMAQQTYVEYCAMFPNQSVKLFKQEWASFFDSYPKNEMLLAEQKIG